MKKRAKWKQQREQKNARACDAAAKYSIRTWKVQAGAMEDHTEGGPQCGWGRTGKVLGKVVQVAQRRPEYRVPCVLWSREQQDVPDLKGLGIVAQRPPMLLELG